MKIFDKRPLGILLATVLGSFVIFSFSAAFLRIIFLFSVFAFLVCTFVFNHQFFKHRLTRICLIASLLSMIVSFIYFDLYFKAYERFCDEQSEIVGEITRFENTDYGISADLKSENINGTNFSQYKLLMSLDYDEAINLHKGARIKITCEIVGFSKNSAFDSVSYYSSLGYSGTITNIVKIEYLESGSQGILDYISLLASSMKIDISAYTDEKVAGLINALFLGDSIQLHPQISLDFRRIGISHLLALSGTHLAILILGFSKLLSHFHINKKLRYIFIIFTTVFYCALTGFSLSVLRAGVMLIISSVLYLLKFKQDGLTTLFIAVGLIVLFEPYAALSVSLWLSALATLGILSYADAEQKIPKDNKRKFSLFIKSLLISLFSVSATLLIVNLCFDGISQIGILTTLIFSPLVELLLYLTVFMIIFGGFSPICKLVNLISEFTIDLSSEISDFEFVYTSGEYILINVLIAVFTVSFALFLILELKNKKRAVVFLCLFYIFINFSSFLISYSNDRRECIVYTQTENSEFIFASSGGVNSAFVIAENDYKTYLDLSILVSDLKITKIDNYVISSYSSGLDFHLYKSLSKIQTNKIYLPKPRNEFEIKEYSKIVDVLKYYRAEIIIYELDTPVLIGDFHYVIASRPRLNENENDGLIIILERDKRYYSYLNSYALLGPKRHIAYELLSESNGVIIGKFDECEYRFNLKIPSVKKLVFASEMTVMGEDVYSFYKNKDIEFYPKRVIFE
jgi:competence protein ComEC